VFADIILAYKIALGALVLVILLKGPGPMKRTIGVMLGVYILQLALAPWLWPTLWWSAAVAGLDLAAIRLVTWRPAGKFQSLIGWTFLLQAAAHSGRVIAELNHKIADMNSYWWLTTALAFIQLFLIGGWLIHDYLGHRSDDSNSVGHSKVHPAHTKGVAR
jgi:hypothetical protein